MTVDICKTFGKTFSLTVLSVYLKCVQLGMYINLTNQLFVVVLWVISTPLMQHLFGFEN